jgi:hypothetical protein
MGFELSPEYKDVPARIADFEAKHPEGCLRPANPEEPYRIEAVSGQFFIVYAAAAYRSPDDPKPGIGVAWEPFPGKTPYTKDSELQNAETSAWGRAIVAVLASTSKSVASAEDVRNRQADAAASQEQVDEAREAVKAATANLTDDQWGQVQAWSKEKRLPPPERLTLTQANEALAFIATLDTPPAAPVEGDTPPSPSTPGAYTQRQQAAKAIADEAPEVAP